MYEFTLADRKRVEFNLSGLGADATLRLLDGERLLLAESSNTGIVEESIIKNLRFTGLRLNLIKFDNDLNLYHTDIWVHAEDKFRDERNIF